MPGVDFSWAFSAPRVLIRCWKIFGDHIFLLLPYHLHSGNLCDFPQKSPPRMRTQLATITFSSSRSDKMRNMTGDGTNGTDSASERPCSRSLFFLLSSLFLFLTVSRVLLTASSATQDTLHDATQDEIDTHSNHAFFCPHRPFPSPLPSHALGQCLPAQKPPPRGRHIHCLSHFWFPFVYLHLVYSFPITGTSQVAVTVQNLAK